MARSGVKYYNRKDSTRVTRKLLKLIIITYLSLGLLKAFKVIDVQDYKHIKISQQQQVIDVQQDVIKRLQMDLKHCKNEEK